MYTSGAIHIQALTGAKIAFACFFFSVGAMLFIMIIVQLVMSQLVHKSKQLGEKRGWMYKKG